MLNWAVNIGRLDIAHATSSLAWFTACPREGYIRLAVRIFGYLRKTPNRRIMINSHDPIFVGGDFAGADKLASRLKDDYPDTTKELDVNLPEPIVNEMIISTLHLCGLRSCAEQDHPPFHHRHHHPTRKNARVLSEQMTGAVATSTYSAEFAALCTAIEETMAIRYMLRCLGVQVSVPSYVMGDNLGVIQNATIKESLLKKKHVAISYHRVREAQLHTLYSPSRSAHKTTLQTQ
jgi:hypothetical protein